MYSSYGLANWELITLSFIVSAGALAVASVIGWVVAAIAMREPAMMETTRSSSMPNEAEAALPQATPAIEPVKTGTRPDRRPELTPV